MEDPGPVYDLHATLLHLMDIEHTLLNQRGLQQNQLSYLHQRRKERLRMAK